LVSVFFAPSSPKANLTKVSPFPMGRKRMTAGNRNIKTGYIKFFISLSLSPWSGSFSPTLK
jgi:hypothetical protein